MNELDTVTTTSHPETLVPPVEHLVSGRKRYRTILADPPWPQTMNNMSRKMSRKALAYPTMTIDEIAALPIADLATDDAHLWLWTTNQFLEDGFRVMREWGLPCPYPLASSVRRRSVVHSQDADDAVRLQVEVRFPS